MTLSTFRIGLHVVMAGLTVSWPVASASADASRQASPWYERAAGRVKDTWNRGDTELYVPVLIHHLRYAYTQEKIDRFNEIPWGIGIGKGTYDEDGNAHGLYAMEFKDSHYKPQYVAGYTYKTVWPLSGQLKAGIGYTAFVTARSDLGHYTPIPAVLPLAALEYRRYSLETIFVPGGRNRGNIFIFWGKVRF